MNRYFGHRSLYFYHKMENFVTNNGVRQPWFRGYKINLQKNLQKFTSMIPVGDQNQNKNDDWGFLYINGYKYMKYKY